MKKLLIIGAAATIVSAGAAFADGVIAIDNVSMRQDRRTQKVYVTYDLANEGNAAAYVVLDIQTNGVSIGRANIKTLSGDISGNDLSQTVTVGTGKEIVWEARKDWKGNLTSNATAVVTAYYADHLYQIPGVYMNVDLSGGASAVHYPVSYTLNAPDVADATASFAKGTLWLKRIEPGVFEMGSPTTEVGHNVNGPETLHQVTLTNPFFIGVFETTQYQYKQLTGTTLSPGAGSSDVYPAAGSVSYNILRGSGTAPNAAPASGSVLAVLSAKTGLSFDLPTEAQWEYACRAGTTTGFYNGTNPSVRSGVDANLSPLSWYIGVANQSFRQIGKKLPNNWGLYDMLGNAYEVVRDYYAADNTAYTLDPLVTSGTKTILRGGSCDSNVDWNRSAWRLSWDFGTAHRALGFRIAWTVGE